MPKAKTMLDELARVLKARENAVNRFDRRLGNCVGKPFGPDLPHERAAAEAKDLTYRLDDRAVMEYDRLMRSNPSRRDMQKAFRMMPGSIVREHDYFNR